MTATKLTKRRIAVAFAVAGFADLMQIPIHILTNNSIIHYFGIPVQLLGIPIDLFAAAVTVILIGFHPALLPGFIAKFVPDVAGIPTWTASVGYVVWSKKGEAGAQPNPSIPVENTNEVKSPRSPLNPKPASSGGWILIIGALVIGYVILHRHSPGKHNERGAAVAASAPIESTTAQLPDAHGKIIVAVGPMESLSSPNVPVNRGFKIDLTNPQPLRRNPQSLNPETICSLVEDRLAQMEGIQVLGKEQMRAFRSQLNNESAGLSESAKTARLRSVLPANIIVLLAILDVHDQRKEFRGYGIKTTSTETTCSVRMQVMNAADGSITFSKILTGSKTEKQTDAATSSTEDSGMAAVIIALQKLDSDDDFNNAIRSKPPPNQNSNP